MVCVPLTKLVAVNCTWLLPLVGTLPSTTAPSLNWTVPVRAVVARLGGAGLTVAVNVTGFPNCDGLADDVKSVVVGARLTVWANGAGVVEGLKRVAPV